MATASQQRWFRRARIWITDKSRGVNEVLAAAGEPLMRYATIYLALATGISYIKYMPLYTACQGIVISVPEFVILGALGVAETSCKEEHSRKWGIMLYGICALLALIMVATFVDIFIYQFPDIAIKSLNFSRCIVAVGFSIVLGKLDQDKGDEQGQQPQPVQPAAPPSEPAIDIEQIASAIEQKISETLAGKLTNLETQLAQIQSEKQDDGQAENETESGQDLGNEEDSERANFEDENGQDDGQEIRNNITVLRPRRQANSRANSRAKNGQSNASTKASKAAALIRKNPEISASDLAKKAGIDTSYARKLLAKRAGDSAS